VPTAAADRNWFSWRAKLAWAGILTFLLAGSAVAWIGVSLSLCEESYSPGSSRFCHEGTEASGAAYITIVIAALVVPATAAVVGSRRLFRVGLALPVPLAFANALLSATFGTQ
jgi:hypothetical protein